VCAWRDRLASSLCFICLDGLVLPLTLTFAACPAPPVENSGLTPHKLWGPECPAGYYVGGYMYVVCTSNEESYYSMKRIRGQSIGIKSVQTKGSRSPVLKVFRIFTLQHMVLNYKGTLEWRWTLKSPSLRNNFKSLFIYFWHRWNGISLQKIKIQSQTDISSHFSLGGGPSRCNICWIPVNFLWEVCFTNCLMPNKF